MQLSTLPSVLLLLLLPTTSTSLVSAQSHGRACAKFQAPHYDTFQPIPFPPPTNKTAIQTLKCPNGMIVTFEGHSATSQHGKIIFDSTALPMEKYTMVGHVEFDIMTDAELELKANRGVKMGEKGFSSVVYGGNRCEVDFKHAKRAKTLTCYKRYNTGKTVHED